MRRTRDAARSGDGVPFEVTKTVSIRDETLQGRPSVESNLSECLASTQRKHDVCVGRMALAFATSGTSAGLRAHLERVDSVAQAALGRCGLQGFVARNVSLRRVLVPLTMQLG